ncbi:transporter, partial [Pseudomonas putida]
GKETLEVQAEVRALNAEMGGGHDHMHMKH